FAPGVEFGFRTKFGGMLVYRDHLRLVSRQKDPATGKIGTHSTDIHFTGGSSWEMTPGGASEVQGNYQLPDGQVLHPSIYKELTLRNVYQGVDLRLYSAQNGMLEFDWVVAHAADYSQIRMNFTGQDGLVFHEDGSASLDLRFQDIDFKMPEVYQVVNGQ